MGELRGSARSDWWTPKRREQQAARTRRQHERTRVGPKDVKRLLQLGHVAESLQPLVRYAQDEHAELLAALGGEDASPQRKLIVEDTILLGVALRGLFARWAQTADETERGELASRMATLASVRRQSLVAVGLARVAKEVHLDRYLAERGPRVGQPEGNLAGNSEPARDVVRDPQLAELVVEASDEPGTRAVQEPAGGEIDFERDLIGKGRRA